MVNVFFFHPVNLLKFHRFEFNCYLTKP